MPIRIPNNLPAATVLKNERVFVMDEKMAFHQDIRPLKIAILNLMPTKIVTETQILRLLSNSPLQVEPTFVHPESYVATHTPMSHMLEFYTTYSEIKDNKYDGLIITGAPVEMMPFEEVEYWDELKAIMEWSKTNVTTTLHICWGSQAGLYYHYGIEKRFLAKKISGVFNHRVVREKSRLLRGFDDYFACPQSRYTYNAIDDVKKIPELEILAVSDEAGLGICASKDRRQIFISGHLEYDRDTLKLEYERDVAKGINPDVPENYFPNNDPSKEPFQQWRSSAYLLYANWLNYYVYQATPFNLDELTKDYKPDTKKGSIDSD